MGHENGVPLDYLLDIRDGGAEVRASVGRVEADVTGLRHAFAPLERRLRQLMLTQLATLGAALGALVAALAA
jgi:hypothetical protein